MVSEAFVGVDPAFEGGDYTTVQVRDVQSEMERKLDLMLTRCAALEGTNDYLRGQIKTLSACLKGKHKEIAELEDTLAQAGDDLDDMAETIGALAEENDTLYHMLDRAAEKLIAREEALAEASRESASLRRRLLARIKVEEPSRG